MLELVIAKSKFHVHDARLVGFSASLNPANLVDIARWFGEGTATFSASHRPVVLSEYVVAEGKDGHTGRVRVLDRASGKQPSLRVRSVFASAAMHVHVSVIR